MEYIRKQNEEFYIAIPMIDDADPDSFKTGLTVSDATYSKDGSGNWSLVPISDEFGEIGSTGIYALTVSSAEASGTQMIIKMTATGAQDSMVAISLLPVDIYTSSVSGGCDLSLNNYDGPTRTEATLDKNEILVTVGNLNDVSLSDISTVVTNSQSAIQSDIGGLNDLSSSDVSASCDLSLSEYGVSTSTEVNSISGDIVDHGDSNWITAIPITVGDVSAGCDLSLSGYGVSTSTEVNNVSGDVVVYGDSNWTTATPITVGDVSAGCDLSLSQYGVAYESSISGIGNIPATIISGSDTISGATIKDIDMGNSNTHIAYRDENNQLRIISIPFVQNEIVASGVDQ